MARACPGIGRYALTIVKSASTLKDVASYEIQVDGTAELWLKSLADFDAYSSSQATKRLRDYGATFIGREIDFITQGKGHHLVSPMTAAAHAQLPTGFLGIEGPHRPAGTKPFRFDLSIFGRPLASPTRRRARQ
jgi:hypothetical protein